MTAGIYIRKSRQDKDAAAARLAAQREQLPAHARAQGWAYEVFDDGYASAARDKVALLPERNRLEQAIRSRRVEIVLVIELSRLSRDDTLEDYVRWLALCGEHGARLATPSRILDPAQSSDWMLLLLEGGFSSVEMRAVRTRMAEGRAAAWEAGRYVGGQVPVGYRHDGARLVVDDERAPAIREAYRLLAEGLAPRAVADRTGLRFHAVRRLQQPRWLAWYEARRPSRERPGEWIAGEWPALIDHETAERVALTRQARSLPPRRSHRIEPLIYGLVRCGYCGTTAPAGIARVTPSGPWWGYKCAWYQRGAPKCRGPRRYGPLVDALAAREILALAADVPRVRAAWVEYAAARDPAAALVAARARGEAIEARRRRLVEAISQGVITLPDAREAMAGIESEREALRREVSEAEAARLVEPQWALLAQLPRLWPRLAPEKQAEAARIVLRGAALYSDRLELHFALPLPGGATRKTVRLWPRQPGKAYKPAQVLRILSAR